MNDKKQLLNEIKGLWSSKEITDFDIAPELLDYLSLDDLILLKRKILNSKENLSKEQQEWLQQFKRF